MRLIDAEELGEKIEEEFDGICAYDVSPDEAIGDFQDIVDSCKTIDAALVVHGHWKNVKRVLNSKWGECSNCNMANDITSYCPHCGAKIDEEAENEV